jgi:hypothetical protein
VILASGCGSLRPAAIRGGIPCRDAEGIDFRNAVVEVAPLGAVRLESGVGYASDAGEGGASRDWRLTLHEELVLRPAPGTVVRLVRLEASHLTGSGEWEHVLAFRCRDGVLERILDERFLYGVDVHRVNDGILRFTYGEWREKDPMCLPSADRVDTYRWDREKGTYRRIDSTLRRRQNFD